MWHKHWRYCCYFTLGSFTLWACLIPIASSRSWIAAKHGCWRYSPCTTQRAREIPNSQYLLSKIPKKKNQITMQHIYAKPKSKTDVTDPHPSSTSLSIFSFLSLCPPFWFESKSPTNPTSITFFLTWCKIWNYFHHSFVNLSLASSFYISFWFVNDI